MGMTRIRGLRRRRARGMAMVEMIFVLPVLLLVVFAIAEFGIMFSRWLTLSNAVREGARVAVVFRQNCNAGTVAQEARDAVKSYAGAGGVGLADPNIDVVGACVNDGRTTVSAVFPFTPHIPFSDSIGTIDLSYSSTMRNE